MSQVPVEILSGGGSVQAQPGAPAKCGISAKSGVPAQPGHQAQAQAQPGTGPGSAPEPDISAPAAELLRLLADSNRRMIFSRLMRGEYCNCELSAELGLPENLVSHHVRKLRAAGLVEEHRDPTDARWVHIRVDLVALGAAWASLSSAFDPSRAGTRLPGCGRLAK